MSKITISNPSNCSGFGFLFLPYRETMGKLVLASTPSFTASPASAVPRKPCSGANTFLIFRFKVNSESTIWVYDSISEGSGSLVGEDPPDLKITEV